MHVRVAEMNVDVPVSDARCIEILASALPVWHGAQAAIDTTFVSPIGRDGQPRGRSAREAGGVLDLPKGMPPYRHRPATQTYYIIVHRYNQNERDCEVCGCKVKNPNWSRHLKCKKHIDN